MFLFSNKMLVIRTGVHKILVRIVNREDPDQTVLGPHCLSKPFWQGASVQNFKHISLSFLK